MIDTGLVLDIAPCINSRPFNKLHCNLNEKAKEYFLLMIYRTMCHPAFKKVEFFQGCDFKLSFSNQIEIQNNQHLQKKEQQHNYHYCRKKEPLQSVHLIQFSPSFHYHKEVFTLMLFEENSSGSEYEMPPFKTLKTDKSAKSDYSMLSISE